MAETSVKIITQAEVPDDLAHLWLQHLRDFDAAYPGCHFEVLMEAGRTVPVREMIETLRIEPELNILEVFARKRAQT